MQLPDVNVLIYAHREDAPEHDRYAGWLRALTDWDELFALSDAVLASFLRIVTNPRIFDPPTPMDNGHRILPASSGLAAGVADHTEPAALGPVRESLPRHKGTARCRGVHRPRWRS